MKSDPFVYWVSAARGGGSGGKRLAPLIGGKGVGLIDCLNAGLQVPASAVLTTEAFWRQASDIGLDRVAMEYRADAIRRSSMAPEIVETLTTLADTLGPKRLAIRSSAVVEDSCQASWAGQFETRLNVTGGALQRAVLECWASLFEHQALRYAERQEVSLGDVGMAVIVQRMVRPKWAGVVFTDSDEQGRMVKDQAALEAVRGLGARLVAGEATPEIRMLCELNGGRVIASSLNLDRLRGRSLPEDWIMGPSEVRELMDGCCRLQATTKQRRLDIEWAWNDRGFSFLQCRPLVRD